MKKLLLFVLVILLGVNLSAFAFEEITSIEDNPVNSTQSMMEENVKLNAEITFDWLDISQAQRDENISNYKKLLFDSSDIFLTQEEFNKKYNEYKKDKDFKMHYMLTNNGVTEDEEAKYCAFYFKKNTLIMYAIQYKNNPRLAFYYTAFGKLYYTDIMSEQYPNYPYTSMQYSRNGKLVSAIYFISQDLQYMYGPNQEFQGIWYKDKMYDKNGKQTLTRTNW